MIHEGSNPNISSMPLLEQVRQLGLADQETIDEVSEYASLEPFAAYFRETLSGSGEAGPSDFDRALSPGWMIALSPEFGRRYLTAEQRRKLLGNADPRLWRGALIAARQRYMPSCRPGASRDFACNRSYALLLCTAWNMLLHGRENLLNAFLLFFRRSSGIGGSLIATGSGFSFDFDGSRIAREGGDCRSSIVRNASKAEDDALDMDDLNAWMHELDLPLKAVMLGSFCKPSPGAMMHGGNIILVKAASLSADGTVNVEEGNNFWGYNSNPGEVVMHFRSRSLVQAEGVKISVDGDDVTCPGTWRRTIPALMDGHTGLFMPVPQGYVPVWDRCGETLSLRRCDGSARVELAIRKALERLAIEVEPTDGTLSDERRGRLLRERAASMDADRAIGWLGRVTWLDVAQLEH